MALREDVAFLTGDGSLGSPIGLLNHVPVGNSIVATPLTGMTNDQIVTTAVGLLNGMRLILKTSMSRMLRPTWIGTPGTFEFFRTLRDDFGGFLFEQQMARGVLLNFPFFETLQLPSNLLAPYGSGSAPVGSQLFLVDFGDVILAETMSIKIDLSDSATYEDAAGNSVSAFTRDQTAYRAIVEHDFWGPAPRFDRRRVVAVVVAARRVQLRERERVLQAGGERRWFGCRVNVGHGADRREQPGHQLRECAWRCATRARVTDR